MAVNFKEFGLPLDNHITNTNTTIMAKEVSFKRIVSFDGKCEDGLIPHYRYYISTISAS